MHSATGDRQFDAESSSVASSSDGIINKKTKWQKIQGNLEGLLIDSFIFWR